VKFQIEVEIDDAAIRSAASKGASELFAPPGYSSGHREGGVGYRAVMAQVEQAVASVDVRDIAKHEAARIAREIVAEQVRSALKKMARDEVRALFAHLALPPDAPSQGNAE
jgi:hypothetical protein